MRTQVSSDSDAQEPVLGRPGAGVSAFQIFLMSRLAKPLTSLIPWSQGLHLFEREGALILEAVAGLPVSVLTTRVLVPRQLFLEDSSRFWSAAMIARHLIIVGEKIARIIVCLGRGEVCTEPANIAEVKPDPATPASAVDDYRNFLARFGRTMREDVVNRRSLMSHPHPWMGLMVPRQWLQFAAAHQHVHRVQLGRILRALA
jgi:uncharacterized damage-inducible protein DinB